MRNRIILVSVLCVLCLAALMYLKGLDAQIPQSNKPVVVIIGDSNSDINSITDVKKWSQDYAEAHQQNQTVINMAIGGHAVEDFNTSDIYQGLRAVNQSVSPNDQIVVVTLLGTNNAIMMEKIDSPEQFIRNYETLLKEVVSILHPKSILIASIPPAFPAQGNIVPYTPNYKAYQLIPQFNAALEKWVMLEPKIGTTQLHFVSILPKGAYDVNMLSTYFIDDGIHLNRFAQGIVLQNVDPAIQVEIAR